jgi:hypothetical protein
MAAFVRVDPAGYRTDLALERWIQLGLDFVTTLPSREARVRHSRRTASRK